MSAAKRNDPKKRPVPEVEKVEKLGKRPAARGPAARGPAARAPAARGPAARGPATRDPAAKDARRGPPRDAGKPPPRGRRDEKRPPSRTDDDAAPVFFGGPRNEFGTRVARRITCSRCGNVDHVPHAPKDANRALCRACAVLVLKTYEVGTRLPVETKPAVCSLCKKPFSLPVRVEITDEILCPDCLRGFATWTGGKETSWESRQDVVVEQRVGGTLVRRRKK